MRRTRTHGSSDRAISPEGTLALGFGLTVLMIAVTGVALMQVGEELDDGGPILSVSADSIDASDDATSQWIRLYHDGGDAVELAETELVVTFSDHRKRAQLHTLPTAGIRQSDYDGNHVFTIGDGGIGGTADADDGDTDGRWNAGDELAVRIEDKRVDLRTGETVTVALRHTESDTQLVEKELDVR